jgi:hypothetical protein
MLRATLLALMPFAVTNFAVDLMIGVTCFSMDGDIPATEEAAHLAQAFEFLGRVRLAG